MNSASAWPEKMPYGVGSVPLRFAFEGDVAVGLDRQIACGVGQRPQSMPAWTGR